LETGEALQQKIAYFGALYGMNINPKAKKGYVVYRVSAMNSYSDFSLQSAESLKSNFIQP